MITQYLKLCQQRQLKSEKSRVVYKREVGIKGTCSAYACEKREWILCDAENDFHGLFLVCVMNFCCWGRS